MKFTKVGNGNIKVTKKGKKAILLDLDPKAQEEMLTGDFQEKIWIFKQEKNGHIYYSVMAPMPDDYEFKTFTQRNNEKNIVD